MRPPVPILPDAGNTTVTDNTATDDHHNSNSNNNSNKSNSNNSNSNNSNTSNLTNAPPPLPLPPPPPTTNRSKPARPRTAPKQGRRAVVNGGVRFRALTDLHSQIPAYQPLGCGCADVEDEKGGGQPWHFEVPSADMRAAALGPNSGVAFYLQRVLKFSEIWFEPIPTPSSKDWLSSHRELMQTYGAYRGALEPNRETIGPTPTRTTIYVVPLGGRQIHPDLVAKLVGLLTAFFRPLPVQMLMPSKGTGESGGGLQMSGLKSARASCISGYGGWSRSSSPFGFAASQGSNFRAVDGRAILRWLTANSRENAVLTLGLTVSRLTAEHGPTVGVSDWSSRVGVYSLYEFLSESTIKPDLSGLRQSGLSESDSSSSDSTTSSEGDDDDDEDKDEAQEMLANFPKSQREGRNSLLVMPRTMRGSLKRGSQTAPILLGKVTTPGQSNAGPPQHGVGHERNDSPGAAGQASPPWSGVRFSTTAANSRGPSKSIFRPAGQARPTITSRNERLNSTSSSVEVEEDEDYVRLAVSMNIFQTRLKAAARTATGMDWGRLFRHHDKDRSGDLELHEFFALCRKTLRMMTEESDLVRIFQSLDNTNQGKILVSELVACTLDLVSRIRYRLQVLDWDHLMHKYASNDNLLWSRFLTLCRDELRLLDDQATLRTVFGALDTHDTGKIPVKELVSFMVTGNLKGENPLNPKTRNGRDPRKGIAHRDSEVPISKTMSKLRKSIHVSSGPVWTVNTNEEFERVAKMVLHQVSHMFGLLHCCYYRCLMNGVATSDEAFRRPPYLCAICLKKLHLALAFHPLERYERLAEAWGAAGSPDIAAWYQTRGGVVRSTLTTFRHRLAPKPKALKALANGSANDTPMSPRKSRPLTPTSTSNSPPPGGRRSLQDGAQNSSGCAPRSRPTSGHRGSLQNGTRTPPTPHGRPSNPAGEDEPVTATSSQNRWWRSGVQEKTNTRPQSNSGKTAPPPLTEANLESPRRSSLPKTPLALREAESPRRGSGVSFAPSLDKGPTVSKQQENRLLESIKAAEKESRDSATKDRPWLGRSKTQEFRIQKKWAKIAQRYHEEGRCPDLTASALPMTKSRSRGNMMNRTRTAPAASSARE